MPTKNNNLFPFGTLPGHWGLKGTTREIAKAEYELTGFELKKRLLEIKESDFPIDVYQKKMLDLNLEYNKITKEEYDRFLIDFIKDETERKIAFLDLDLKEGTINQTEHEKQVANIKKEPWVTVIGMEFGGEKMLEGAFELDWNEYFVEELKKAGYVGPSSDHIVNQWFMEISKNVALQEFDGTGNFNADAEANLEAMKRWTGPEETSSTGKRIYK